jgi:hypothetical protein
MNEHLFRAIVCFVAALGCFGVANQIMKFIFQDIRERASDWREPRFYVPWTSLEILSLHKALVPRSYLRLWLYVAVAGAFVMLFVAGALLPDPRA